MDSLLIYRIHIYSNTALVYLMYRICTYPYTDSSWILIYHRHIPSYSNECVGVYSIMCTHTHSYSDKCVRVYYSIYMWMNRIHVHIRYHMNYVHAYAFIRVGPWHFWLITCRFIGICVYVCTMYMCTYYTHSRRLYICHVFIIYMHVHDLLYIYVTIYICLYVYINTYT